MDAKASSTLAPVVVRDGDVDWTVERTQETPVNGRGSVTQYRTVPTSKNRCHPPCLFAQPLVANRIDTTMQAMKEPSLSALGDRALRQPHLDELRCRHDSMLLACHTRDAQIHRGALVNHEDTKAPRWSISPPLCA